MSEALSYLISMLTGSRLRSLCQFALASAACVACLPGCMYSQSQNDDARPILKHQSAPIQSYGVPDTQGDVYVHRLESSQTEVAPGLVLPDAGHVWALDSFAGQPQLVRMKYTVVQTNNHTAENVVKAAVVPFVYKPKISWEIPGQASVVRLHNATPAIFFVGLPDAEDAADPKAALGSLTLVRLKADGGKRGVSTVTFTQFTGKSKRYEEQIETRIEKFGEHGWYKIFPTKPLPAGEYALVQLPKRANLMGANIFDFAVDPDAPQNPNAVLGSPVGVRDSTSK